MQYEVFRVEIDKVGNARSGNYGHAGRPEQRGGSAPGTGGNGSVEHIDVVKEYIKTLPYGERWLRDFNWTFVKQSKSSWHEDNYAFTYTPKGGKIVEEPLIAGSDIKHQVVVFAVPPGGSDKLPANNPDRSYRGMSSDEWHAAQKQGFVKSEGKYNFSSEKGLTLFAEDISSADSYAGGFAPAHLAGSRVSPGVIVSVDKELTKPGSAYSAYRSTPDKIPLSEIKEVYFMYPKKASIGEISFDKDTLTGKVSSGSGAHWSAYQYSYHQQPLPVAKIGTSESGNRGHAGVIGHRGGSAPAVGHSATIKTKEGRIAYIQEISDGKIGSGKARSILVALNSYRDGGYYDIRTGKNDSCKRQMKLLEELVQKAKPYSGDTLYRGFAMPENMAAFTNMKVGGTVKMGRGVSSWSSSDKVAEGFSGPNFAGGVIPYMFKLVGGVSKGTSVTFAGEAEQEVLLSGTSRFRILSIERVYDRGHSKRDRPTTHVTVKEIKARTKTVWYWEVNPIVIEKEQQKYVSIVNRWQLDDELEIVDVEKVGTSESGNYGHASVRGHRGGSAPGTGAATSSPLNATEEEMSKQYDHCIALLEDCQSEARDLKSVSQDEIQTHIESNPQLKSDFDSYAEKYVKNIFTHDELAVAGLKPGAYPDDVMDRCRRAAIHNLVNNWATTSGDNNTHSIALQAAAHYEFGLGGSLDHYRGTETIAAAKKEYDENGKAYRSFLRAQYDLTQKKLAEHGISELIVCRGVGESGVLYGPKGDREYPPRIIGTKQFRMAPMSSFTLDPGTAMDFSEGGGSPHPTILYARVPASRVLSYPRTGFGCKQEFEVVILGGRADKMLSVPYAGTDRTELHSGFPNSIHNNLSGELQRTQRRHKEEAELLSSKTSALTNIDADLNDADWPKRSWDLPKMGTHEFEDFLKHNDMTLDEFKKLPVYRHTLNVAKRGTSRSGNYGHASVRGHHGGSAPGSESMLPTKVVDGKRVMADGSPLPKHIQNCYIPPGWHSIIINPDPKAVMLVKGKNIKNKDVYVYEKKYKSNQAAVKQKRVSKMFAKMDQIAKKNNINRRSRDASTREVADCLHLIMETSIRPGSDKDTGADVKAYGATTLEGRHVIIKEGAVRLQFVAKKGVHADVIIETADTANMLRKRAKVAGPNGKLFQTDDKKLLAYSKKVSGGFLTKDYRTYMANKTALVEVAKLPKPKTEKEYKDSVRAVAKVVAAKLCNTHTVALQSYINPAVFAGWRAAL